MDEVYHRALKASVVQPRTDVRVLAAIPIEPEQHQHQHQAIVVRFELVHRSFAGQHVAKCRVAEDLEREPIVEAD